MKFNGVFIIVLLIEFCNSSSVYCPNSEDIKPCKCSNHEDLLEMLCDGQLVTETTIEDAFQANFPIKEFDEFYMRFNRFINAFNKPLFNGVTFKRIYIYDNENLFYFNGSFFEGQENTLEELHLSQNQLGNNGFPYAMLPEFPYLNYLDLRENGINTLPIPIPSNNLATLYYENNGYYY